MTEVISDTYLNVQVARASAVLPAAGAFDTTPSVLRCSGFRTVTVYAEYTRGAAGGKVKIKPESSPVNTGDVWHEITDYGQAANVAGSDSVSTLQRELLEYASTGAAVEKFIFSCALSGGDERIRIACAESGVAGSPGTVKLTAVFS